MSIFNTVRAPRVKRSQMNLSHERKLSLRFADLVPFYVQEVIPSDSFEISQESMLRMAPMISPVMHRVDLCMYYFFVPNRLVWNQWQTFVTGGKDGLENPAYPRIVPNNDDNLSGFMKVGSLWDHMGLPLLPDAIQYSPPVSALPFRSYALIWNEYFRDQNLHDEIDFSKDGGDLDQAERAKILQLRKKSWRKDYYTSSLPYPQKGDEVGIPVDFNYKDVSEVYESTSGNPANTAENLEIGEPGELVVNPGGSASNARIENLEDEGVSVSINELRKAARLQEWLEKNARGGNRYIEQILMHFGIVSSDSRLQRPEFLMGHKQPVTISEVLNTTGATDDSGGGSDIEFLPQGNMAGHGISASGSPRFKRRFEEHGYIIGVMSVIPKSSYTSQGIPRHFQKFDKYDLAWPSFAHLGEQEVFTKELYWDTLDQEIAQNEIFGYQQRYAEYKFNPDIVTGKFRDDLEFWHMARTFNEKPVLNGDFITADPTDRIFAVQDPEAEQLYAQIYLNVKAKRPLPLHSIPRL